MSTPSLSLEDDTFHSENSHNCRARTRNSLKELQCMYVIVTTLLSRLVLLYWGKDLVLIHPIYINSVGVVFSLLVGQSLHSRNIRLVLLSRPRVTVRAPHELSDAIVATFPWQVDWSSEQIASRPYMLSRATPIQVVEYSKNRSKTFGQMLPFVSPPECTVNWLHAALSWRNATPVLNPPW